MIISASRRTDIPAFHSEWMMNRLKEKYVLVRNPYNARQLSRISLDPGQTDCIVFWTKNPMPMESRLSDISEMGYAFYFQFTLTGYGKDMEPGLPDKERLADAFCRLGEKLGPVRVDWRYDPIIITEKYTPEWHQETFARLCRHLRPYTTRCILSFVDEYAHLGRQIKAPKQDQIERTAKLLGETAETAGLPLYTCAEAWDLSTYKIHKGACIDLAKIEEILDCPLEVGKDKGQRPECGCISSIDIGAYNTCGHGCAYCYANTSPKTAAVNSGRCPAASPMLGGWPSGNEKITERPVRSWRSCQMKLKI